MSKVINIQAQQQCIEEILPDQLYNVPVLNGSERQLVAHRELRTKYHTNRSIKTWSVFFLLKAMTTSGKIFRWTSGKQLILSWCQCNENTFRRHLSAMKALKLCSVDKTTKTITLVSFEKAAEILDIPYSGVTYIKYNPYINNGKQIFQFFIRAEEFRQEQQRQLEGLMYHLEKNPSLKNDLHYMLMKEGAESSRLHNVVYFQTRLLEMQKRLFKEGSELLSYIFSRRADINRSGSLIKEHHKYKSKQSVSYLKKRMHQLKVIAVTKVKVESQARSRLYVPDGDRKRDGYKWVAHKQPNGTILGGHTVWFLCDQISFNYTTEQTRTNEKGKKKAA